MQQRFAFTGIHDAADSKGTELGETIPQYTGSQKPGLVPPVILGTECTAVVTGTGRRYFDIDGIDCCAVKPLHDSTGVKNELVTI